MTRKHVLCANTQFTCVQFFPTGVQGKYVRQTIHSHVNIITEFEFAFD